MNKYQHIQFEEREAICIGRAKGYSIRKIATMLKRSPSSISREILGNKGLNNSYQLCAAQKRAREKAQKPRKQSKLTTNKKLRRFVVKYLQLLWSPEQIAKKIRLMYPDDMDMRISHETIYKYLYVRPRGELKNLLIRSLRQNRQRRRKRKKRSVTHIHDMISIDQRPLEVRDRTVPGHWEGDVIIGSSFSVLGTLVERTTRLVLMVKIRSREAHYVRHAFARLFQRFPSDLKKSLTYDQGKEMSQHRLFTKETNIQVYFAHPRSPWERGSNENTNGLIRQFFPKGINFDKVSYYEVRKAQKLLNDRPRKTLDWLSPNEVWSQLLHL